MGKRKKAAKKPGGPKKREKLPTSFQCLFCNHENSVTVTIDKKAGVGDLNCKVCGQSYQSNVNTLSAAVDVYADWIDACDAVAKEKASAARSSRPRPSAAVGGVGGGRADEDEGLNDGFVVDDEIDAEGEFADDD